MCVDASASAVLSDRSPARAVNYLRISDDRSDGGPAVARQEVDTMALVESTGWRVAVVYVDNDIGAYKQLAERPASDCARQDLQAVEFDAILCVDLDRRIR